jgi:hypothetical protein
MITKPVILKKNKSDINALVAHFWQINNGRLLILYDTSIAKDLNAALRHNRLLHEYCVTSNRLFNSVKYCLTTSSIQRIYKEYQPNNVLLLTNKVVTAETIQQCLNRIDVSKLKLTICVELV